MNWNRRKKSQRGFTMIELMIAIGIIGILAAIATPIFMRARFKAYHSACLQNVRNIATALELYHLEWDLYPDNLMTLTLPPKPYISAIEICPSNGLRYDTLYTTSNAGLEYVVPCPGVHELQLQQICEDLYPQAINGRIDIYRSP